MTFSPESSTRSSQLEWPQEVVSLLEVRSNSVDLIDKVLNSGNVVLAQNLFNSAVLFNGDSLPVDLSETSLEHKSSDALLSRVSVGNVRLNSPEHINGGLVNSDEDTVMELSKSEKPHDSDDLRVKLVDTPDSDNKGELGFSWYVNLSGKLGLNYKKDTFLLASMSARVAVW